MAVVPPSHKPRTRGRRSKPPTSRTGGSGTRYDTSTNSFKPAFPLAALLWPVRAGSIPSSVVLSLALMVTGLFRWAVGLWGYSGYQSPPMHGDFEAQRHWMEITIHLPISQWYFYDLEWWGLDYPPLTAYHSWVLGKTGSAIDPTWFALDDSRGLENPLLKLFMRATVLVSEYIIFVPALIILARRLERIQLVDSWDCSLAIVAILMQPGNVLVDHGHFQYNTVMLGFFLASLSSLYAERQLWCCIFFVAALGFKQMALYYAPAMFACLLGICFSPHVNLYLLTRIVLITALSFLLLFGPLLLGGLRDGPVHSDPEVVKGHPFTTIASMPLFGYYLQDSTAWFYPPMQQLFQSIHRIFPFARGIFEDKVANFWCVANLAVKLHHYPASLLQRASLAATVTAILPPCAILSLRPRSDALLYGFATTAWGFFLFSFQVHEKSILLPLLPMTVMLAQRDGMVPTVRAWVGFANMLGVWTMYPLLNRDQLRIPYFVVSLLWAYLLDLPPVSLSLYSKSCQPADSRVHPAEKVLHLACYTLIAAWHVLDAAFAAPESKPDLWVVLNAAVGSAGFGMCYLWCLWQCLMKSGLVDFGTERAPSTAKAEHRTGLKSAVQKAR